MKKKQKEEKKALRSELENYRQQGVSLWLDGQPGTPKSIVRAHMVAEEGIYMRDYVQDEKGEIERIQFDLVKNK